MDARTGNSAKNACLKPQHMEGGIDFSGCGSMEFTAIWVLNFLWFIKKNICLPLTSQSVIMCLALIAFNSMFMIIKTGQ